MNNFDTRSATFALIIFMVGIELLKFFGFVSAGYLYQRFGLYSGAPAINGITYAFIHGGLLHIGFNMFAMAQLGTILERNVGMQKFLLFSLLAAVIAGFGGLWLQSAIRGPSIIPIIGYSGVLFAYVGAIFRAQLENSRNWKKTAIRIAKANPILIALIVVPIILPIGIAGEVHLVGLVFGLIAGPYFFRQPFHN